MLHSVAPCSRQLLQPSVGIRKPSSSNLVSISLYANENSRFFSAQKSGIWSVNQRDPSAQDP